MSGPAVSAPPETTRHGRRRPARRSGRRLARLAAIYLALIVGGLAMMIPFLWMLTTSLKTRSEVFSSAPFTFPTRAPLGELHDDVVRPART